MSSPRVAARLTVLPGLLCRRVSEDCGCARLLIPGGRVPQPDLSGAGACHEDAPRCPIACPCPAAGWCPACCSERAEKGTNRERSTIIIPAAGIPWFRELFNYYAGGTNEAGCAGAVAPHWLSRARMQLHTYAHAPDVGSWWGRSSLSRPRSFSSSSARTREAVSCASRRAAPGEAASRQCGCSHLAHCLAHRAACGPVQECFRRMCVRAKCPRTRFGPRHKLIWCARRRRPLPVWRGSCPKRQGRGPVCRLA